MNKIDKTTDHMGMAKTQNDPDFQGDPMAMCLGEIVDKINKIIEWINSQ
tara:strand:+ start:502 stop:648 length:147 start_codon:yes stop_codon:yes gene_type:complete